MPKYIDTIYDPKLRPLTAYPDQLAQYLVERFHINKGQSLLDLGCGRGDFAKAFQRAGVDVRGADIEATASTIIEGVEVAHFDIERDRYPYPDNTFDIVFSKSVLEHMSDPRNFLEEQRRILKTGGRIIVLTPDWVTQMKIFYNDYTHRQPYTLLGTRHALHSFGFKGVSVEIFYQYPLYWKYPALTIIAKCLQLLGPVRKLYKNKFYRWSRELMILGTGTK